ncbi:hypothetical protein DPMN_012549 [Dreissena polymorpha]|uniref:Uncharacterized protein n=1 Tax=Dreissena polymorpha TaxID=45954 RepID=A0A9D4N2P0_DREPO|nr:hypothetical protein DPMN_012549 [Dreissena polymorpha]
MTELIKEDGEDVFANSVLVRRDMVTGTNSFNIGQYLRARNICPSSLRIELGDNGRLIYGGFITLQFRHTEFTVENGSREIMAMMLPQKINACTHEIKKITVHPQDRDHRESQTQVVCHLNPSAYLAVYPNISPTTLKKPELLEMQ